jgi:hypothetical protein
MIHGQQNIKCLLLITDTANDSAPNVQKDQDEIKAIKISKLYLPMQLKRKNACVTHKKSREDSGYCVPQCEYHCFKS